MKIVILFNFVMDIFVYDVFKCVFVIINKLYELNLILELLMKVLLMIFVIICLVLKDCLFFFFIVKEDMVYILSIVL